MENCENNNINIDSQQASKLLMSSYLIFLKNMSNKNPDEVEMKLKQIIEILNDLSEKNLFSNEEESESQKYFVNDFLPELLKILLNENCKNPTIRDLTQEILNIYTLEFHKSLSYINSENSDFSINLWEKIVNIFNDENSFYRTHSENKDAAEIYLDHIYESLNPNHIEWRNSLKPGDYLDYLHKENISGSSMYKSLGICNWTRAEILNIDQNKVAQIKLLGTDDIINLSINSYYLMPYKSLSLDFEWRESIKKNDEIDYLDNKSWYRSTALEVNEVLKTNGNEYPSFSNNSGFKNTLAQKAKNCKTDEEKKTNKKKYIKYGLRIYRDNARNTDSKGNSFFGWGETYDKEVSVHDPKIRIPNTFSKIIYNYDIINYYPLDSKKFTELETIVPHEFNENKFYIIPKKYDNKNTSIFYYEILNFFCIKLNGLENITRILNLINNFDTNNKNNIIDQFFPVFCTIITFFNHINQFLHFGFAKFYLKEILDISFSILIKFSLIETRNFKRDKFENLIKQIRDIMFRVYMESDVNAILDVFGIEFGINCLKNSIILDKKLLGFKVLSDTMTEVTKNLNNSTGFSDRHIPAKTLVERIVEENIFEIIYGPSSHSQILQKSSDFLKSLLVSKSLSHKDLQKLFDICDVSTDLDTKSSIYRGFIANSTYFSIDCALFLINYVISKKNNGEKNSNKITNEDIDLIISAFKSLPLNMTKEISKKVGDFLFNIIFLEEENYEENQPQNSNNSNGGQLNISNFSCLKYEKTIEDFLILMKSIEFRDHSSKVIEDIIKILNNEILDNRKSVSKKDFIGILKVLRLIMSSYLNILDDSTRSKLLLMIYDQYNLLDLLMNFITEYHKESFEILKKENLENKNSKISNKIFKVTRNQTHSHTDVVNEIMNFINYMMTSQKMINLTKDQILSLYNIYVENPLDKSDINIFFKMLKEADNKKAIPQDVFQHVFELMIKSQKIEFSEISLDLFNCVWNFFLIINKNKNNLILNENKPENYYTVGPSGQQLFSSSYNTDKKNDQEIKCLVDPDNLVGFDLIWKLVLSINNSTVSKEAMNNIIKIYLNFEKSNEENKLFESKGYSWGLLIERCINTIKKVQLSSGKNEKSNPEDQTKILNCLEILRNLIEETEKKGTAGCVSHNSLLKSSIVNLKIENCIFSKSNSNNYNSSNENNKNNKTGDEKSFTLKVFSNTTLWDLKKLIAGKINTLPEGIRINTNNSKDITDNDHGKTIGDLNIKEGEKLTILLSSVFQNIPRHPLTKNSQFTEKAKKVFTEIFGLFNDENNLMNQENAARFATIATDSPEPLLVDDQRVKQLFETYDFDKDGFVTLEGFHKFFYDSLEVYRKLDTVWDNIRCFGYRNDLKKYNEPLDEYNTNLSIMPRFVISKNQDYFDVIFGLQDEDEKIAREASKFLSIICTNPNIYRDILLLKDLDLLKENDMDSWTKFIDVTNKFKLLYVLQIIESFFEEFEFINTDVDSESFETTILDDEEKELLYPNHKIRWIEHFLTRGGLELIIQKLYLNINVNEMISSHLLWKKILNLSTKIIKNSFSFLFRALNLNKIEVVQFIRKESLGAMEDLNTNKNEINHVSPDSFPNVPLSHGNEQELSNGNNLELSKQYSRKLSKDIENLKQDEELINLIHEKYGDKVINRINFEQISYKLIVFSYIISLKKETEVEERNLLNNSVNLLSLIIISQQNIKIFLHNLFSLHEDISDLISKNENIFNPIVLNNPNFKIKILTFEKFILLGILRNTNLLIRFNFQKCLSSLCFSLNKIEEYSLNVFLINMIKDLICDLTNEEKTCSKYLFLLFANLYEMNTQINEDDEEKLCFTLIGLIFENPSNLTEEVFNGYLKILILILKKRTELIEKINKNYDIVNKIIDSYILKDVKKLTDKIDEISEDLEIKFLKNEQISNFFEEKSNISYFSDTRSTIYNLIYILTKDNYDNLNNLFSKKFSRISDYLSNLKKDKKNYNPFSDRRKAGTNIGLKNLHSICYMNSVLQQFFNVPSFRYALIQANDNQPPKYTDENKEIDDNFLHQLQRMFVFLEYSGQPANVNIQNDAQEFLGRLFDKVEFSLKNTEFKYLLNSIFVGKTCSQLICKGGCGKVRNNFEDFYSMSLEVQGKKTLKDSLEKFISEERIEEYMCDTCQKKVTVIKRNSFAELPNVMIIHFQRIIFNYDTFMNEKINSRLEFPKKLNLKQYCTENINNLENNLETDEEFLNSKDENNLELDENLKEFKDRVFTKHDDYYDYELVGVVVHLGVANAGHYFSYINIQRDGEENKMNFNPADENHLKKWMTFNDSSVTNFHIDSLESECFGGNASGKNDPEDSFGWGKKNDWDNSKNAYMLVYERIKKTPIILIVSNNQENENNKNLIENKRINDKIINFRKENQYKIMKNINKIICGVSLDCDDTVISRRDINFKTIYDFIFYNEDIDEYSYYIPFYNYAKKNNRLLPTEFTKEVLIDNLLFLNDQNIFCAEFLDFLEKTITNLFEFYQKDTNKEKNENLCKKIFNNLIDYSLNIISKSSSRDSLSKFINSLVKFLPLYPEFSKVCLENLISNKNILSDILFSNEENSNIAYKNLIYNAILSYSHFFKNEIFEYKNLKNQKEYECDLSNNIKPLSFQIMDILLEYLPTELSKIWNRMLAYLELFEELANSNIESILDYLFENEIIFRFIDLALGKESPYFFKGESRNEIGNKMAPPKFTPLLNTVSLLTRHCYTPTWNREFYETYNEKPNTFIYLNDNPNKIYSLSEREWNCLNQRPFYKKCIKDNYHNTALSKLLAHIMFENYELSKKRIFMVMEAVNDGISLSDAKSACELIFNILNINDKYNIVRLEWIMGIPQLQIKLTDTQFPKIIKNSDRYSDKLYRYISTLLYGTNHESLIERLIYKYQASSEFITILNYFFSIIFKNPYTFIYFDSLPHPKNENSKLKDYVFNLANEELNRIFNITNTESKFENAIKGMTNIMNNYEEKKLEFLNIIEENYQENNFKFQPIYHLGEILKETINHHEDDLINKYNVYSFILDYENILEEENIMNIGNYTNNNIENINNLNNIESQNSQNFDKKESIDNKYINDYVEEIEPLDDPKNVYKKLPSNEAEDKNDLNNSKDAVMGENNNFNNPNSNIIDLTNLDENKIENKNNLIEFISNDDNKNNFSPLENNIQFEDFSRNNEDLFYKKNIMNLLQNQKYTRCNEEILLLSKNKYTQNCIKRIILYNNSDNEYKIKFKFKNRDDYENLYLPKSEIVVIAKKNSVTNIQTFIKYDYLLPWNNFDFNISCEIYDNGTFNDNRYKDSNDLFKRSKSSGNVKEGIEGGEKTLLTLGKFFYNLKALPAPTTDEKFGPTTNDFADDSFPIECPKCVYKTYFNSNSTSYICKGCKCDLFS